MYVCMYLCLPAFTSRQTFGTPAQTSHTRNLPNPPCRPEKKKRNVWRKSVLQQLPRERNISPNNEKWRYIQPTRKAQRNEWINDSLFLFPFALSDIRFRHHFFFNYIFFTCNSLVLSRGHMSLSPVTNIYFSFATFPFHFPALFFPVRGGEVAWGVRVAGTFTAIFLPHRNGMIVLRVEN